MKREAPRRQQNSSTQTETGAFDAPNGSESILIVDDEPVVLRLCCSILSRQGYQVLSAGNGEDALKLCEELEKDVNLLLSDIIMPKLKGTDLAERVVRIYPDIRVLYMSGFDGREIPEYDSLRRTARLIPKPFTPKDLLVAVRAALDNPPIL